MDRIRQRDKSINSGLMVPTAPRRGCDTQIRSFRLGRHPGQPLRTLVPVTPPRRWLSMGRREAGFSTSQRACVSTHLTGNRTLILFNEAVRLADPDAPAMTAVDAPLA